MNWSKPLHLLYFIGAHTHTHIPKHKHTYTNFSNTDHLIVLLWSHLFCHCSIKTFVISPMSHDVNDFAYMYVLKYIYIFIYLTRYDRTGYIRENVSAFVYQWTIFVKGVEHFMILANLLLYTIVYIRARLGFLFLFDQIVSLSCTVQHNLSVRYSLCISVMCCIACISTIYIVFAAWYTILKDWE